MAQESINQAQQPESGVLQQVANIPTQAIISSVNLGIDIINSPIEGTVKGIVSIFSSIFNLFKTSPDSSSTPSKETSQS